MPGSPTYFVAVVRFQPVRFVVKKMQAIIAVAGTLQTGPDQRMRTTADVPSEAGGVSAKFEVLAWIAEIIIERLIVPAVAKTPPPSRLPYSTRVPTCPQK